MTHPPINRCGVTAPNTVLLDTFYAGKKEELERMFPVKAESMYMLEVFATEAFRPSHQFISRV